MLTRIARRLLVLGHAPWSAYWLVAGLVAAGGLIHWLRTGSGLGATIVGVWAVVGVIGLLRKAGTRGGTGAEPGGGARGEQGGARESKGEQRGRRRGDR